MYCKEGAVHDDIGFVQKNLIHRKGSQVESENVEVKAKNEE